MALNIKNLLGKLFRKSGYDAIGNQISPVDLGPGISGSSAAYYGYNPGYDSGGDGSKYRYGLSSTGAAPIIDHSMMRLNARSVYHGSMLARGMIDRYADLIPGVGLKMEATPDASVLGITDEQAEEWGEKTTRDFDIFMRSKKFTLSEDMTGYQSQRFVTISQFRDGEYFARLNYRRDPNLLNPLQISFVDPVQIQDAAFTNTYGLPLISPGIERDPSGREVAYNVLVFDYNDSSSKTVRIPRVGRRSGRTMMLHGYSREYAGQTRGYSMIGHLIQEFENLTDFEVSHIKTAINQASIAMYTTSKDMPNINPMEDIVGGPAGPMYPPNDPGTPASSADGVSTDVIEYSELNEVNLRPGSIGLFNMQAGQDLQTLKNNAPMDNYHTFVDAFVKSLAASRSMPAEVLWMQFNENFSASRAALVLCWQVVEIWRAELEADYLDPIYEMWLSGEIASGRKEAPGWSDPRMRQAWLKNQWIGFPMPNIDPMKTAKADEIYVNMGAQTLDRVALNLNGSSGRANRAKLTREFKELPRSPFLKGTGGNGEMGEEKGKSNKPGPGRPIGS